MPTPIDIAISPPTTYLHLKPGSTTTHQVSLEQKGTLRLEITPSLVDFTTDGETGQPKLGTSSSFRFVQLSLPNSQTSTTSFTLEPNQKKQVLLTFTIPDSAAEGEFPLTLLFRAKPNSEFTVGNGQSEANAILGSNIIALISETEADRSQIEVESISAPRLVDSFMPITFSLIAHNSGKNASTIDGKATISNWQGTQVAEFLFYPDMVLANSSREVRTAPTVKDAEFDLSLVSNVFEYKSTFLFGKYTITATSKQETSLVSQSVIALPFSLLFIFLISIGVWFFFNYLKTK